MSRRIFSLMNSSSLIKYLRCKLAPPLPFIAVGSIVPIWRWKIGTVISKNFRSCWTLPNISSSCLEIISSLQKWLLNNSGVTLCDPVGISMSGACSIIWKIGLHSNFSLSRSFLSGDSDGGSRRRNGLTMPGCPFSHRLHPVRRRIFSGNCQPLGTCQNFPS